MKEHVHNFLVFVHRFFEEDIFLSTTLAVIDLSLKFLLLYINIRSAGKMDSLSGRYELVT